MRSKHEFYADFDQEFDSLFSAESRSINRGSVSSLHSHTQPREGSSDVWEAIRSLPGVKNWRVVNDAVFLLTSFPMALAAFMIAIIGGTVGLSLSFVLIGLPILVWTVGSLLRGAAYERERLNAFLGTDLRQPRYTNDEGANVAKHLLAIVRSPNVRRDLAYMLLLFPIALLELILVLLPLEFILPSLAYLGTGSIFSPDMFGLVAVNSFPLAMGGLVFGGLSLVPIGLLIMLIARWHGKFAIKWLA